MFGLAAPRVQRAIEKLPDAPRCDRYLGWREGEQPEVPPLVSRRVLVVLWWWQHSLTGGTPGVHVAARRLAVAPCTGPRGQAAGCNTPCLSNAPAPHLLALLCCAMQSSKEQCERLACEARMLQLPEGVRGVPVLPWWVGGPAQRAESRASCPNGGGGMMH